MCSWLEVGNLIFEIWGSMSIVGCGGCNDVRACCSSERVVNERFWMKSLYDATV